MNDICDDILFCIFEYLDLEDIYDIRLNIK